VFGIAASVEEGRREPTLTGAPRLVSADPLRLDPPERLAPIADRERARWLGPLGSLVLHLLPLLLLIEWPFEAPPETVPIAVQLVLEPPPPEKLLKPVPPPPPFKPPPPGRIASEDLGDTEVKQASREPKNAPAAKDIAPPEVRPNEAPPQAAEDVPPPSVKTEPPPEAPQQTAAIVPPPPPEKPPPPKPQQKPSQTTRPVIHWEEEPEHSTPRRAKYPGPAATRDEYLAYVHSLIRQHYNMLPLAMIGGRRGETRVEFVVLDDGTIAMIRVRQSSGWPDIDERVEQMILAVHHVPPLPQWFQGPSMALILNLPFPDALRE
jgi:TonB family protein